MLSGSWLQCPNCRAQRIFHRLSTPGSLLSYYRRHDNLGQQRYFSNSYSLDRGAPLANLKELDRSWLHRSCARRTQRAEWQHASNTTATSTSATTSSVTDDRGQIIIRQNIVFSAPYYLAYYSLENALAGDTTITAANNFPGSTSFVLSVVEVQGAFSFQPPGSFQLSSLVGASPPDPNIPTLLIEAAMVGQTGTLGGTSITFASGTTLQSATPFYTIQSPEFAFALGAFNGFVAPTTTASNLTVNSPAQVRALALGVGATPQPYCRSPSNVTLEIYRLC
jgi:hypothetical protein